MEYRLLGLSGCAVSALALGTLTFANERGQIQRDRRMSGGRF
jgi:aryl-alcohol dehydrogenase-like predicted oxidoreductase